MVELCIRLGGRNAARGMRRVELAVGLDICVRGIEMVGI